MKLGCQKHSPTPPFELNREISQRSDKLSETSVLAVNRGSSVDAPVYHCSGTDVQDMQEMISTVKLDDRATAACGSKNGRYELPRAIDVC
ncbi:hypothetical protein G5I_06477 [Acromyrmex echinatior]|uniref:Uncharacterized protein n=1 Tax=Acromyrmex echinatior TaxID=103372 RepID=F4WL53_ACREC|nr:hypothetical protein G5I_06477 [Acromyrmex echinatior]